MSPLIVDGLRARNSRVIAESQSVQPRPYQTEGIDWLAPRQFGLLAFDMRLGKTMIAIKAAYQRGAKSLAVVCPAIAVPHWEREIIKWWPGDRLPRTAILSYNRATALWEAGLKGRTDVFIPDECHFAKNPEAKRTRMVYGKTGFGQHAGAIWPLSGTPAPKHAGELWCMLKAFGVVGMAYDEFLRYYCVVDSLGIVRGTRVAKIPELRELLAKVMLRRTRKQVAPEMPGIDFQFLEVKPTSDADFGIPEGLTDEQLTDWLETHQVADREDRIAVALAKVDPLVENISFTIENGLLKQTVVFGWHVDPLQDLTRKLWNKGITAELINGQTSPRQREIIQDNFRNGLTQVVVGNIAACGTAIDLSSASHGYFLELWWVGSDNVQAANRLVSMDKAEPVTFDVVTWPGSTDDRVQQVLMRRMSEVKAMGLA